MKCLPACFPIPMQLTNSSHNGKNKADRNHLHNSTINFHTSGLPAKPVVRPVVRLCKLRSEGQCCVASKVHELKEPPVKDPKGSHTYEMSSLPSQEARAKKSRAPESYLPKATCQTSQDYLSKLHRKLQAASGHMLYSRTLKQRAGSSSCNHTRCTKLPANKRRGNRIAAVGGGNATLSPCARITGLQASGTISCITGLFL